MQIFAPAPNAECLSANRGSTPALRNPSGDGSEQCKALIVLKNHIMINYIMLNTLFALLQMT